MLRILVAALAVVCLCGFCACATTGTTTASTPTTNSSPLTPATSHFWCGEHCVVLAGCEDGFFCLCVSFGGVNAPQTPEVAETSLWRIALDKIKKGGFPNMTFAKLRLQPHEIREVHGLLGGRLVCGVFPRYGQFGTVQQKSPESVSASGFEAAERQLDQEYEEAEKELR